MAARAKLRYSVRVIHGSPAPNLQRCERRCRSNRDFHARPNGTRPYPHRQRSGTRRALRALSRAGDSVLARVQLNSTQQLKNENT